MQASRALSDQTIPHFYLSISALASRRAYSRRPCDVRITDRLPRGSAGNIIDAQLPCSEPLIARTLLGLIRIRLPIWFRSIGVTDARGRSVQLITIRIGRMEPWYLSWERLCFSVSLLATRPVVSDIMDRCSLTSESASTAPQRAPFCTDKSTLFVLLVVQAATPGGQV